MMQKKLALSILTKNIINNLPKEQDKENFRNKIKNLLNARNDCLEYSKNKESTPTKQENILIGCLNTWYGSMIDMLNFHQPITHIFFIFHLVQNISKNFKH